MKKRLVFVIAMFALLVPHSCNINDEAQFEKLSEQAAEDFSLQRILKRGTLIASTDYNSTNYFIYRGEPAGYEFELLSLFAKELGVELQIKVNNNIEDAFKDLNNGQVDIIAMGLSVTGKRNQLVDFTKPMGQTRQVLVQKLPKGWRRMKTADDIEEKLIRNPLDLAGKMVYVPQHSSHLNRLRNLQDEIGDSIFIVEYPRDAEKLIEMVANDEIEYSICDEHIAIVNKKYYPEIDIKTAISFPQHMAWAVAKDSDSLKNKINGWLDLFLDSKIARFVYNKYFVNPRSMQYAHKYYSVRSGKISDWDEIVKEQCRDINWDWRLVASLIYQESRFQPDATSWMGAFGLMQLMPGTATLYGIDSLASPEKNIEAGIKHLKALDERLKDIVTNPGERIKFVLAAYNAGIAHVFDARRLAEKYQRNPNIWKDNVDFFLLNKSDPKYYNDSVVFYGYCRGQESYNYVNDILNRFEHYKNVIED